MSNPGLDTSATTAEVSEPHRELARRHPRGKKSTKEKIDKLVAEGAKNYPAYLKLIYTGDSELSSEDEFCSADNKAKLNARKVLVSRITRESEAGSVMKPSVVISPESTKLMDPGREKLPTPVDHSHESKPVASSASYSVCECTTGSGELNVEKAQKLNSGPKDPECLSEEEKELEELRLELIQVQEEILTLKAVLNTKMKVAGDLKRKLGITPMVELKQSIQNIKESGTYQKTNAAFRSFGAFASRKMGNLRNSSVFKSVEEKVGGAYGTVKQSRSMGNIQSRTNTMSSSRSENNVAEMTMNATDLIDDEIKSDEPCNAISNPYADM